MPYEGWPKLYPETIAEELSKENEVVVITPKLFSGLSSLKPSIESWNNIKIYRFYPLNIYGISYPAKHHPLWMKPIWHLIDIWNPHSYFVIKKILKKENPDVVHTLNLTGLSTSVFAAVKASGCPHVHTIHDCALISPWANLLRNGEMINFNFFDKQYIRIKRFLSRSADVVLALSRFMLEIHLQNGYFKKRPFYILTYPYRPLPSSLKDKSYTPIDILFVGNIDKGKGIYVLLDAFKHLGRNDVNLHFVGRGSELENLRREAHGLSNVHIHGYMSDEDLADMYNRANITVVPSLCYEAGPAAAFLESLPFGTPVIGSDIGGIPEAIIDGVNGKLFEPGNSSELRDILEDLIDNQDRLKEMEGEALKSAEEYRPEKYIASLLKVYRGLKRGNPH
jgi:glycosyltransferase involved in cell wall biosynthesis